jgi:hypothetical protein
MPHREDNRAPWDAARGALVAPRTRPYIHSSMSSVIVPQRVHGSCDQARRGEARRGPLRGSGVMQCNATRTKRLYSLHRDDAARAQRGADAGDGDAADVAEEPRYALRVPHLGGIVCSGAVPAMLRARVAARRLGSRRHNPIRDTPLRATLNVRGSGCSPSSSAGRGGDGKGGKGC